VAPAIREALAAHLCQQGMAEMIKGCTGLRIAAEDRSDAPLPGGSVAEGAVGASFQLVWYLGYAAGDNLVTELAGIVSAVHMGGG
jgi:hypothetical protein